MEYLGNCNSICACTHSIKISGREFIKCYEHQGEDLPFSVPFIEDKELCVAMKLSKTEHVIPDSEINPLEMYRCPYRETIDEIFRLIYKSNKSS